MMLYKILFLILIFGAVTVTSAQTVLLESQPADGETVTVKLNELRLVFDKPVQEASVSIIKGTIEFDARSRLEAETVFITFDPTWDKGKYQVNWTIKTADGEDLSGTYSFEYDPAPTAEEKRIGTILIVVSVIAFITLLLWQRYELPPFTKKRQDVEPE
jgi:methionine-rich copper-binding protein CopC